MSEAFRNLLRKVGSGPHTSEDLTRTEAAAATRMMLTQEATPAQIGAFMIAHRIKRPTGEELAGMLDAYDELGPKLTPIASQFPEGVIAAPVPTIVMSIPYDGRSRTAPVNPLVALILATMGCPVVMHGGRRMPTKEGIPLIKIWQELGVDWSTLSLSQVQQVFEQTRLGFVYLPSHFPLAEGLVSYREEIGKRPPFATLELFWCPYAGNSLLVCGFVHPPTEEMARSAFALRGTNRFMTVKGLEGSCDLPRERTCIIGIHRSPDQAELERLLLHPRDYGFDAAEVPLKDEGRYLEQIRTVLQGEPSELLESTVWSGGFYLWQSGLCPDLAIGLAEARRLLASGKVLQFLKELQESLGKV